MILKKFLIKINTTNAADKTINPGFQITEAGDDNSGSSLAHINGENRRQSRKKRSGEAKLTCYLKDNTDGLSVSGHGLPGLCSPLQHVAQLFPGSSL